ncbi:MAG TPA: hypothetical protein VK524_26640 [Polyangiaceae bacterium]|nr:hypothetical protein [Polyangiaceae bacterium]
MKLTHDERVKLARLALRGATAADEAAAYQKMPPGPDEFSLADEPMAWEAEGWEEFSAPR